MEVDDVSDFAGDESDDDDISVKETRGNGGVMDDEGTRMRGMTMIEGPDTKDGVWWYVLVCVLCESLRTVGLGTRQKCKPIKFRQI